ncbi:MAG TPA: hypothetical protein LFW20_08135 [Rickettsia endosymbiont of Omalisus fontisbellaquei]|nr:hypothetical protein [Rickettsia endosymbiont of Omalisus fontisbellaquei]
MKKTILKEEDKIIKIYDLDNYSHDDIDENDLSKMWRLMLDSDYNYHLGMTKREHYESEDYEIIEDKIFFLKNIAG